MRIRATSAPKSVNTSSTRRDAIPRSAHALRRNPRPRATPLVSSHFFPPHHTRIMGNVASQHYDGASPRRKIFRHFRARKVSRRIPQFRRGERRRVRPSPAVSDAFSGRAAAKSPRGSFRAVFRARFGPRRARETRRASNPGLVLLGRFLLTCASSSPNRRPPVQNNTTRRTTSTRALWTT